MVNTNICNPSRHRSFVSHFSSVTNLFDPDSDLPIVLWKGNCTSTIYPLFLIYLPVTGPLLVLCLLILFHPLINRHYNLLGGNMHWMRRQKLYIDTIFGISLSFLLENELLVANGILLSNIILMALLRGIKRSYLLKITLNIWGWLFWNSPMPHLSSQQLLSSTTIIEDRPLYQSYIKNAFLHGDMQEKVNMEQLPGYVAQEESQIMC